MDVMIKDKLFRAAATTYRIGRIGCVGLLFVNLVYEGRLSLLPGQRAFTSGTLGAYRPHKRSKR